MSALAWKRTDGFRISEIEGPLFLPSRSDLSEEVLEILQQPFTYLGKGRQCFVFESADHKTVIKFFNQSYTQMPWYEAFLFNQEWKRKELFKRAQRKRYYLSSYLLAEKELKEETALLFVHQGGCAKKLPQLHITDRASRNWSLDLNQIPFILQKKGESFYHSLEQVATLEGSAGMQRWIDQYLDFLALRMEKQIADADQDTEHNLGVLDGHICLLDPGRLYREEQLQDPKRRKEEWERATRQLRSWLQSHHPSACLYLDQRLQAL